MKRLVTMLVVGFLLVATAAFADDQPVRADDCSGDSFLEMSSAGHGHAGDWLAHRLVMCRAWANGDLSNKSNIKFRISLDDDAGAERRIKIDAGSDGKLYAELWNRDMTRRIRDLPVSRPNDRSVEVRFKARMLRRHVPYYDWNAMTVSHGCEAPPEDGPFGGSANRCWDYLPAPGEGKVRHRLK